MINNNLVRENSFKQEQSENIADKALNSRLEIVSFHNQEEINEAFQIEKIFASDSLSESEQVEKLNEKFELYKQVDENTLRKIVVKQMGSTFKNRIGDCFSTSEFALLKILELICERGASMPMITVGQSSKTVLYDDMKASKLISKIESLIRLKVAEEDKSEVLPSETSEHLIRTYFWMMKGQKIWNVGMELYVKVIRKNINNLHKRFRKQDQKDQIENNDEETIIMMESLARTLVALRGLYYINQDYLVKDKKIYKEITPLLFINCPTNMHCSELIIHRFVLSLKALKETVITILGEFSYWYNEVKNYLVKQPSIVIHLSELFVNFINSLSQKLRQKDQQIIILPSQALISASLYILKNLLFESQSRSQSVSSIHGLISSLIKLCMYKLGEHNINGDTRQIEEIRINSHECLYWIKLYMNGDLNIQKEYVQGGYAYMLVICGSTEGGCGEEDNGIIGGILDDLFTHMTEIRELNEQDAHQIELQPGTLVLKEYQEIFQEQEYYEEVEAQLFRNQDDNKIKDKANSVKVSIMNNFVDDTGDDN